MYADKQILISGAGPSGLALAIFLADKGYRPRIIDKKTVVSPYSKAFAVNARTLSLLEESGITKRFIENGRKMTGTTIWKKDQLFFQNDLSKSENKYPFILIQSQRESELILQEELSKRKIEVEFGTQLQKLEQISTGYRSTLQNDDTISFESDIVVGADGSRSDVRTQAGMEFPAFGYRGMWELYDVELEVDIPSDHANLFFYDDGGMILIRIKDNLWRLAGSMPDLLNYLPKGTTVGKITWQAKFNIGHHIAKTLVKDNVVLIGDAAHIHSPFGGRGMNLGIEDAFLVANAIHNNAVGEYSASRLPYLLKTVGRINRMTTFVTGNSGMPLFMKKCSWMAKPFFPIARPMMRSFVLGIS